LQIGHSNIGITTDWTSIQVFAFYFEMPMVLRFYRRCQQGFRKL